MSVCETHVVDAIGIEKGSGRVVLTISDHLEWDHDHLHILEEKVNSYISFIESGELLQAYPDAHKREPVIDVVCKYEPNEEAKRFFENARDTLARIGVEFRHRTLEV